MSHRIFNIEEMEDLPSNLKRELLLNPSDLKILQVLFLAEEPVSLNQILAAVYRTFGEVWGRVSTGKRLALIEKKGWVQASLPDFFELTEEVREISGSSLESIYSSLDANEKEELPLIEEVKQKRKRRRD